MKMVIFTSAVFFIISYMFYNALTISEYFKEIKETYDTKKHCVKIDTRLPMEDFVNYKDEYLIGSSANYHKLQRIASTEQSDKGSMFVYSFKTNILQEVEIKNLPNIPFLPHGIDLYKGEYLYIINHSLTKEYGERVELVKINYSPLSLEYVKSFVLPSSFIAKNKRIINVKNNNT